MRRPTPLALILLLFVAATGCDEPPFTPEMDAALRLDPVGDPTEIPGFSGPESMLHDPVDDVYLVSNVNPHPQVLSNDGFISRVAPDGTIEELEWIRGGGDVTLHAPTGMVLVDDVLYVADADAVRLFDRATGEPIDSWPVPVDTEEVPGMPGVEWVRGALLNDICAGPRGEIYLTATGIDADLEGGIVPTGQDAIYTFRDGSPEVIAEGAHLMGPNGCWVVGSNLHVVSLLGDQLYRLNASGRQFQVATLPAGGLDGLVRVGGSFFVSSVLEGEIYRLSLGGSDVVTVMSGLVSPADLGFDHDRGRLLVPSLFGDFVLVQLVD